MASEDNSILGPVSFAIIKTLAIGLLVLAAVGALGVAVIPRYPDSVICINPVSDAVFTGFAYAFIALCLAGLLCIFVKPLRLPVGVGTCILGVFLLVAACFNAIFAHGNYIMVKGHEADERPCVITYHMHHRIPGTPVKSVTEDYYMEYRYLDDGKKEVIATDTRPVYYRMLNQGDTCVAYVRNGMLGIRFITYVKCVKRMRE